MCGETRGGCCAGMRAAAIAWCGVSRTPVLRAAAAAGRLVTTVLIHLPILTWDLRVPASLFLPLQFGTMLVLMAFEGLLKVVDRCAAAAAL